MLIASHSQTYILVGESRHGGVDNCGACVNHFLRGVAQGQPLSYLSARIWDIPIFAGGVSEACRNNFDRRVIGEMRSQGSNHCYLFGQKGGIPENRNTDLHSIIREGEEAAPGTLNGSVDPGWSGCLGVNSQQDPFAHSCTSCHRRIKIGKVESSVTGLQSAPVLAKRDPVHVRIGQNAAPRLDAVVC